MKPQAYRVACSQPDFVLFPGSLSGLTSPPAPVILRVRVHPLLSLTSPSEFAPFQTCPALSHGAPSLGFPSPSRHRPEESTCERASRAHPTVRPRRFSRPRRFAPPRALRVCFAPQPRPGFTFQGLFPLPSRFASSAPRPLLSLPVFTCDRVTPATPDPTASPSGCSSGQRSENIDRVISPGDASIPS